LSTLCGFVMFSRHSPLSASTISSFYAGDSFCSTILRDRRGLS
jgi:hypothetical protein